MFCVRLFDEQCFEVDSRHHRHRGRGGGRRLRGSGGIFNGFFFVATCAGLLLVAARWLVDQLGGGTGGCGGAAARRLTSGGLRRVPALFPVDLAALCGSLERLVLATLLQKSAVRGAVVFGKSCVPERVQTCHWIEPTVGFPTV